jgi:hypothetical protein
MSKDLGWLDAIKQILSEEKSPLHYSEITEKILSRGLKQTLGATPSATVNAQISSSIKHKGDKSPFVKVSPGTYGLKDYTVSNNTTETTKELPEVEEQYEIFTCFGMFWKRDGVDWDRNRLLGAQNTNSLHVDLYKQVGVYLLYDGREVIYVGRSTDRPLGKRLNEHIYDRLATRWDRFSWFGLLPISEDGKLGTLPKSYQADSIIPALEAILIEAVEPRQNRKRGDDLSAVEFLQIVDPEIEKRRIKATMDAALNRL